MGIQPLKPLPRLAPMYRILLSLFLLCPAMLAQANTFVVHNPRALWYQPKLAQRLYDAAIRKTAEELNPQNPRRIEVTLTLELGEKDLWEYKDGITVVHMKEWNAGKFVQACVWSATARSLDQKARLHVAQEAYAVANAIIDADELKK